MLRDSGAAPTTRAMASERSRVNLPSPAGRTATRTNTSIRGSDAGETCCSRNQPSATASASPATVAATTDCVSRQAQQVASAEHATNRTHIRTAQRVGSALPGPIAASNIGNTCEKRVLQYTAPALALTSPPNDWR